MERVREWLLWIGWRRIMLTVTVAPVALVAGWWMLRLPPPPVDTMIPVAPTAAVTTGAEWLPPLDTLAPQLVAVHVVGAVAQPGVYRLAPGARADDALRAAGGASRDADLRRVNLAAVVHDGEQLVIPRVGERLPTSTQPASSTDTRDGGRGTTGDVTQPAATTTTVQLIVDLNRATVDDLDRLPGVGPSTARAIIDHRTRNGPFSSVDDLLAVRGIGPVTLAEIRPWVRV